MRPVGVPFAPGADPRRGPGYKRGKVATLAEYIRRETRQGRELVDRLLAIARGESTTTREVATKEGGAVTLTDHPTHREQLVALQTLIDHGLGSAVSADKMPEPETPEPAGGEADGSIEPPKLGVA